MNGGRISGHPLGLMMRELEPTRDGLSIMNRITFEKYPSRGECILGLLGHLGSNRSFPLGVFS